MINRQFSHILLLSALLILLSGGIRTYSQINGSLFIKSDNFYNQIFNPASFRTDGAISFSFAGLAGASVINQGNYKISDVITLNENKDPRIDFKNFYENSNQQNYLRQNLVLPILFTAFPFKKGVASFYYAENLTGYSMVQQEVLAFLNNGNIAGEYMNFNSEEIKLAGFGYREFAFGYGKTVRNHLNIGIRAKILFGAAQADTKSWNYSVLTSPGSDTVTIASGGKGRMMIPLSLNLREDNSILSVDTENAIGEYFGEYGNPGLAFDLGFSWQKSDMHFFSGAIRDLGFIVFRSKSYNMIQNDSFDFIGFDLESAIRYPEESGYQNSVSLVKEIKDEIRMIFQPNVEERKYSYMMPVKSVLHYHYQPSVKYIFGATSQMAFGKNSFYSVFTLSALQDWNNFSVFENLNLHNLEDITFGGGIRYEGNNFEIFAATDNLIAFYHPADNKTLSLTFGMCFLIGKEKNEATLKNAGFRKGNGRTSKELPFYKDLR